MTATIAIAPVRKRIRVAASPTHAFDVFTRRMTRWWPPEHSINTSPIEAVVLEPEVGGRWYERGENGSECRWGTVLVWEPPARLILNWQINPQWQFDAALTTEVEVRFQGDGDGTIVELEHRLEGYGAAAVQMRGVFDRLKGWGDIVERYGRAAA